MAANLLIKAYTALVQATQRSVLPCIFLHGQYILLQIPSLKEAGNQGQGLLHGGPLALQFPFQVGPFGLLPAVIQEAFETSMYRLGF